MSTAFDAALSILLNELVASLRRRLVDNEEWGGISSDLDPIGIGGSRDDKTCKNEMKTWIELEDLVYDLEEVLEEFDYNLRHSQAQGKKPEWFSNVERIYGRAKDVVEWEKEIELIRGKAIIPKLREIGDSSSPFSGEPILHGRDAEKKEIIQFLVGNSNGGEHRVDVLPVVGAGGTGKTALVQHIYCDSEVVRSFPFRVWVCIGQDWNLVKIFKAIVEAVTYQHCDFEDIQSIQRKVSYGLMDKKILIILDDVWKFDIIAWEQLRATVMAGALVSKVLITTRNANVAKPAMTVASHITLHYLSENDCLKLLCSHAGFDVRTSSNSNLVKVVRDVSKKCQGLPLAARLIGSILHGAKEENWRAMLNYNSVWWQDARLAIDSVLKMSYNDLPSHLKRCFKYCAIFPENYEFEENEVVQLWTAAGLIKCDMQREQEEDMEALGHSYVMDFISRSLLTPVGLHRYAMHGLIRDMGRTALLDEYKRWETELGSWERTRHLSVHKSIMFQVMTSLRQEGNDRTFALRTFMALGGDYNIQQFDDNLFSKLRKLRALHLTNLPTKRVPASIGQLKLLKYLNIAGSSNLTELPPAISSLVDLNYLNLRCCISLTKLPQEIGSLMNLRHLDLSDCKILSELPQEIGGLINLCHLDLSGCRYLIELPQEIGSLLNLRYLDLSWCMALIELPQQMENLKNLSHLDLRGCRALLKMPQETKSLFNLRHFYLNKHKYLKRYHAKLKEVPLEKVVDDEMKTKEEMKIENSDLFLQFSHMGGYKSAMPEILILKGSMQLKELHLKIGELTRLRYIDLSRIRIIGFLPESCFLLTNLKVLILRDCKHLEEVPTNVKKLINLSYLDISGCCELKTLLSEIGNLSNPSELDMRQCKSMISLPTEIGNVHNLSKLYISECTGLTCISSKILLKLDLSFVQLEELISQFKLLKRLDLSGTEITTLPESTMNLNNLEELFLKDCTQLKKLPTKIGKLTNLLHLYISGCSKLKSLPSGIGDLENLVTLSDLPVGEGNESPLMLLRTLGKVQGSLTISGLQNVTYDVGPDIIGNKRLTNLTLIWSPQHQHINEAPYNARPSRVLEQLLPHQDLQELSIQGYIGLHFPYWLAASCIYLRHLTVLRLLNCVKCRSLIIQDALLSMKKLVVLHCVRLEIKLPRLPALTHLELQHCGGLDCVKDFSLDSVKEFIIKSIQTVGSTFLEKIRRSPHRNALETSRKCYLSDHGKDITRTSFGDEENNVEVLVVEEQSSLLHLPHWVCDSESINSLKVRACPQLKTLSLTGYFPATLTSIQIDGCEELTSIAPQRRLPTKLEKLDIYNCPKLEIIAKPMPNELLSLDIRYCRSLTTLSLCCSLQSLSIIGCSPAILKSLVAEEEHCIFPNLKKLDLAKFPGCVSLPPEESSSTMSLPKSLTCLNLDTFPDLKRLSSSLQLGSLVDISIANCLVLESLPESWLSASLQTLNIGHCPMLSRKLEGMQNLHVMF